MSNDLVVMEQKPAFLQSAVPAGTNEFGGGLPGGIALPFLSIRGKEFRIRKDGQEVSLRVRELPVVFIAARPNVSKRYYETAYSSDASIMPTCHSTDGVTPDVATPVYPDCASCPNNVWGSRITPAGKQAKECQDYKRIIVGIFSEKGLAPVVLDVPATSLKAPRGQKHQDVMMLREYLGALSRHNIDPTTGVTKLSFTDAEYPQISFSFGGYVGESTWNEVRGLRDDKDVLEALGNSDIYDFPPATAVDSPPTTAVESPPATAGVGTPAPPAPTKAPVGTPVQAPVQAPLQAPVGTPAPPAPVQAPLQAPVQAPLQAEPPTIESLGDEDLMSEIEKLLKD